MDWLLRMFVWFTLGGVVAILGIFLLPVLIVALIGVWLVGALR